MINKTLIQIILSFLIIVSLFLFYKTYFKNQKRLSLQTEKIDENVIKENDKETTLSYVKNQETLSFKVKIRIDTAMEWNYFLNDGILNYVLKNIANSA